jgi:hypothetical protein
MGAKGNSGGKKGRSGRKSKAEELGLAALLDKCWTVADREKCLRALAKTANDPLSSDRMDAVKLLMGYSFGKPTEKKEITGEGGGPLTLKVVYA